MNGNKYEVWATVWSSELEQPIKNENRCSGRRQNLEKSENESGSQGLLRKKGHSL